MTRQIHGCACCGIGFGAMFRSNKAVREILDRGGGWTNDADGWSFDLGSLDRRSFLKAGVLSAGVASVMPNAARAQADVTTVFTGGTVLTVDSDFSVADAIAIRGNTILAVGSDAEVREAAGPGATVIDLDGKTVLPGFIDAHTHVVSGAVVDSLMDYVGMARFGSAAEVLEELSRLADTTPAGGWITARNYDPAIQTGPDALTFNELDAVSTEHPVFVLNASGHLAYANSKAFEVAGIPDDVENPEGAEFVRDLDGKLNGVMKNNVAYLKVLEKNPALVEMQPLDALIRLLGKWSKFGLTTVSELSLGGLAGPADASILTAAARSGKLSARIRAYPFYTVGADVWDEAGVRQGDGDALARIAGYKFVADGSNQGFTGLQREPYLDSNSRGLAYMTVEELTAATVERAGKGWHLSIHGNGDAAIDNVLDACAAIRDSGIDMSKVRARIEHCSILHDDQIARMRELGVSASFLIGHVYYWGIAMRDSIFGEEKAMLLDRCRSAEKAGVGFTLHSDFMVTDPDPLHMIEMAVTRKTWKEPDYVLAPDERIPVESAIRAVTSEAAWQLFSEHEIGTLEPGKMADLVILETDPRTVDPDTIKDIKVLETWMDGKQVYAA